MTDQVARAKAGNGAWQRVGYRLGLALVLVAAMAVAPAVTIAQGQLPWMDTSLPPEQRADLLLAAMTLDQKLEQIYNKPVYNKDLDADGDPKTANPTRVDCNFTLVGRHIEGIPALAIPDFRMANGGTGIRGGDCSPEPIATALPAQIAGAATFDRQLNYQWGQLLDSEVSAWAHN